MRVWRMMAMALVLAAGLLATGSPAHAAGETAQKYVVDAKVDTAGNLKVTETLTFTGAAPETIEQRIATFRDGTDQKVYRYTISDVAATASGSALNVTTRQDSGYLVVSISTSGASGPITISYSVSGATVALPDGNVEVAWRVLQGLSVNVIEASGTLAVPAQPLDVQCQSGPPISLSTCGTYSGGTHDSPNLSFTDGPRGVGEVVDLQVKTPSGAVAVTEKVSYRWSLDRAFRPGLWQIAAALGVLLVGGALLTVLHRRAGRDAAAHAQPTTVAEFVAVGPGQSEFVVTGDVRPGMVGTVADEHVDPMDVLGTILDLAVRGHLLITQESTGSQGVIDWTLTRREDGDTLADYEAKLLDALTPAGEPVRVSGLAASVVPAIGDVQASLYQEVVNRGWFSQRPDKVRRVWVRRAWLALILAGGIALALVIWTTFGLLALALIAVALGLMFVADEMPARTAAGASLLAGLRQLAMQLDSAPTDQLPHGAEYATVSKIIPYAVVLGGYERWLAALVAADDDVEADPTDLSWYHAPADWHLQQLPESLDALITAIRGRLFSR